MHEFRLVDHATGEILDRCKDLGEAKTVRESLQASRGAAVAIRKVRLPDPPVPAALQARWTRTVAGKAHLDLSIERFGDLGWVTGVSEEVLEQALDRIRERLRSGPWNLAAYRTIRRRYRATPSDDGGAPTIDCDPVELAVVRVLAQTYPYNQFSITPKGDVFVGHQMGYHREAARLYVTTLSPVLDETADLLLKRSLGEGGRVYIHRTEIERAADGTLLAYVSPPRT
jgi:hypothetical protein